MKKTVPYTVYIQDGKLASQGVGERVVIGTAIVNDDYSCALTIDEDKMDLVRSLGVFDSEIGTYSISTNSKENNA